MRYSLVNWVLKLGSILVVPLVVFMSTSLDLFLENQGELIHIEYLYPFLGLCMGIYGLGLGLYWISGRFGGFRWVMGLYYSFPIYFFMNAYFMKEENHIGELNLLILMFGVLVLNIGVIWGIGRYGLWRNMEGFLGLFGVLLMVYEGFNFGYRYRVWGEGGDWVSKGGIGEFEGVVSSDGGVKKGVRKDLPNIYHIVLDGFQTDYFEDMLEENPKLKEEFEGFIDYPHNISGYKRTEKSLAMMFEGRYPLLEEDWGIFQREAFEGEGGFLSDLRRAGYTRYNANLAWNYPRQFDYDLKHDNFFKDPKNKEKIKELVSKDESFIQFWINEYIPFMIRRIFFHWIGESFQTFQFGFRFIFGEKKVVKESFRKVSKGNGYYYIHLPIPHFPYFLDSSCDFTGQIRAVTLYFFRINQMSMLEQAKCTMRIVMEYLRELRELDQYDGSLIVIQGDHGSYGFYVGEDERVKEVEVGSREFYHWFRYYRSRALLMMKPVGVGRKEGFRRSGKRSHLLDIGPTVLKEVGYPVGEKYEGESLFEDEEDDLKDRKRYFYGYAQKEGKIIDVLVKYEVDEFGGMREVEGYGEKGLGLDIFGNLKIGSELVNLEVSLPLDYKPNDLEELDTRYVILGRKVFLRREASKALGRMLDDAKGLGLDLKVISGYRSSEYQEGLFESAEERYGEGQDLVAKPGHSEHQLGTAVDLSSGSIGYVLEESFAKTREWKWLEENSSRYGYYLSYSLENHREKGYSWEPWHYRYWGDEEFRD